jgi:glycosyltransferase involved in cell wall biosynthesis
LLGKPAILSEHNVEALVWYQINCLKKQRWKRLLLFEKLMCKGFDHIVIQTLLDKKFIEAHFAVHPSKVTVIPNGVDTQRFSPKKDEGETIRLKYGLRDEPLVLFTGRLNWFANEDALKIIFSEIYPALKKCIPNAVFMVVGTNPPSWLINFNRRDVIITHALHHDVASYINAADVCIAPLRFGSGMCLKTLEYMSCEKPVVSTSCGARGLKVTNGENIVIENDFKLFAERIAQILEDKYLAARIGKKARKLVEGIYDWKIIAKKFAEIYERLLISK